MRHHQSGSYNSAGAQVGKRLRVTRSGLTNLDLNGTFTYDNEGRMTGEQYPQSGPSLTYGFDTMGRLNSLSDGTTVIGSASYGPAGELKQLSGGSWGTETRSYNAMLQLTQLTSPGWNLQYNYSATQNNGKIVSQTDVVSGEQVGYAYDSLNRLAEAVTADNPSVAQWGQSFTFDGFGNLSNVSVIKGSAPIYTASYNAGTNQQTADCADANGNIFGLASCAGTGAYAYDVENRITAPANAGGMRYSYAPDNKRVWRGGNGSTDEVTYWGVTGQRLGTYQLSVNSGQLVCTPTGVEYYFGSKLIKNASGFVYQDRLGSTVKTYPYGTERPSATQNGKEKFATYFRDAETGLDYADQRYHQPGVGRFLTPDPAAPGGLANPNSWNLYAYVSGDPINGIDPTGTFDMKPYLSAVSRDEGGPPPSFCDEHPEFPACWCPNGICLPVGSGGPPADPPPCWSDLGKIDQTLNENIEGIFDKVYTKGFTADQLYKLVGALETAAENEETAIGLYYQYGGTGPDPAYYKGGHFNLVVSYSALQDNEVLGQAMFDKFQQDVNGRSDNDPYAGGGALHAKENNRSDQDAFHLDSSNATGDVAGLFRHVGRDVMRGNIGSPCLDPPWSNQ